MTSNRALEASPVHSGYEQNNEWWRAQLERLPEIMANAQGFRSIRFEIPRSSYYEVFGFYAAALFMPGWRPEPKGWLVDLLNKLRELGYEPKIYISTAVTGGVACGMYLGSEIFVSLGCSGFDTVDDTFKKACFDKTPPDSSLTASLTRQWRLGLTALVLVGALGWFGITKHIELMHRLSDVQQEGMR